jgi:hypothetical protein
MADHPEDATVVKTCFSPGCPDPTMANRPVCAAHWAKVQPEARKRLLQMFWSANVDDAMWAYNRLMVYAAQGHLK